MSIQFVWEDKYSVGNPDIDNEHKEMFALGNKLPEISSEKEVKSLIMRLYKYVRVHFTHEEEMMKAIGFPLLEEHTSLHGDLLSQLNKISSQPLDTDEALWKFKKFVYDWLISHIMNEGQKYFEFINI